MLQAMPAKLFAEWTAFYQREPFGFQANAIVSAAPIAAISAMLGNKRPRVEDFMIVLRSSKPKQTTEQMHAIFKAFASAHNKAEAQKRRGA